ncbi:MAG: cytochrome c oxidase subunit II [Bacteroidetes bacterium]|nr:cytochrome c oxidase subunit II [Bacteroidota bacterium]MCL5737383.1 cytochrome c oxidase subunit II [Bacteroidota bacterium]
MRFIVGTDIVLFLIVIGIMLLFVFKYNKKRHPRAVNIHGNTTLEVVWTVVPVALVLFMFYVGWEGYIQTRVVPKDAMPVKVIGRQWNWSFQYENGKQSDTLYLPQGQPIKCLITSLDVIHGFYIPAFREKQDALPDRVRYMMLYPEKLGTYEITCSMYCGLNHALMATRMVVVPKDLFTKWVNTGVVSVPKVESVDTTQAKGS